MAERTVIVLLPIDGFRVFGRGGGSCTQSVKLGRVRRDSEPMHRQSACTADAPVPNRQQYCRHQQPENACHGWCLAAGWMLA